MCQLIFISAWNKMEILNDIEPVLGKKKKNKTNKLYIYSQALITMHQTDYVKLIQSIAPSCSTSWL